MRNKIKKKIISKKEFVRLNSDSARKMFNNQNLQKKAKEVLVEADKYRWIHQSSWMGEPILNLPQDIIALENIIWKTKPKNIIEVGVAWGGGLLLGASLLELYSSGRVIGIDIFIPDDLKKRLLNKGKISKRISLIEGSSIDKTTIKKLKKIINNEKKNLVILDSHHTHDHVLEELKIYKNFVGKGNYIIVGDTIVEDVPVQKHRPRPWGPGNNPKTAMKKFLRTNNRFKIDKSIDEKLLISCHPNGYLKAKY
jgi:cephalosporin hydroxylase